MSRANLQIAEFYIWSNIDVGHFPPESQEADWQNQFWAAGVIWGTPAFLNQLTDQIVLKKGIPPVCSSECFLLPSEQQGSLLPLSFMSKFAYQLAL